jgi:sterol desaturase/sphingolipid hydroxylase (fatty acid hydroxylase superfamily)
MFESQWLERFSRIHPATPFVVWGPVAVYFLWRARALGSMAVPTMALLFVGGMFLWSLAEYLLHRYVFHFCHDSRWGRRIHFLLHGVHHEFPNDADRLVMPLLTSTPMAIVFYALFALALGPASGSAFFAGFVVGYLFYDGTHYYVHHFVPGNRWGKLLRRHHLTHHFADHHGGFGVSSPLWDVVFRSMPRKRGAV